MMKKMKKMNKTYKCPDCGTTSNNPADVLLEFFCMCAGGYNEN